MSTIHSFRSPLFVACACSLAAVIAHDAPASDLYWSGNGVVQGGAGAWDTASSRWSVAAAGPFLSNWNNASNDAAIFGGGAAGTVTLGTAITVGGLQFDTAGDVITGNTLTFGSAGSLAANQAATISSKLSGTVAITKTGPGTLTLNGSAVNTFNGGTLLADFANLATPTGFINSGNAIGFAGGILSIKGKSSGTTSQSLGNVTVNAGGGQILGNRNGGTSTTINLGSITATATGGSLLVGSGGTSPGITTTTNKDATGIYGGRTVFYNDTASTGYDWATTATGASPFTLSAYGGYTALPTSGGVSATNYNLTASTALSGGFSVNTLKFAPATIASQTLDLGTNTLTIDGGGLLRPDCPSIQQRGRHRQRSNRQQYGHLCRDRRQRRQRGFPREVRPGHPGSNRS